ncbi:HTH-type transcriptional regulator GltC [Sporomusa rhizae]|uniref:LysR family transcriptional regulator n=1 Tax=Sporomusa rhizae TaxID=357999 RepID=UPI00352A3434
MNIQKYMAFIKTVEYGSFTKAAQFLDYTQSGISHMINDLEAEWGVALLERDRSGVRITSDGLKLLPYAKRVCEANNQLLAMIDELHGLKSGLIRIGTFSSVATHWLPNMIRTFQTEYPNIEFELLLGDYTEIENWVIEGRVDFGFLRLPAKSDLETIFLEQDRLLAIIPENHPLADCDHFPIKGLLQAPFMLLEKGAKNEISEIFEKHNITPDIRFTTWDDYSIMAMVEKGLGISILPELILQRVPYKILAKELEVPAYRKIGIVMKDAKTVSLAVNRFLDYIQYRNKI